MKKKILLISYSDVGSGGPYNVVKTISDIFENDLNYKIKIIKLKKKFSFGKSNKIKFFLNKFDLIHFHSFFNLNQLFFFWIATKLGLSTVFSIHGNLNKWSLAQKYLQKKIYLLFFKRILNLSTRVHLLSEVEKKEYLKISSLSKRNINIIPNYVEVEGLFQEKNIDKKILKILFFSRIHKKKGIFELIKAIEILNQKNNLKFMLSICGFADNRTLQELKKIINEKNLNNLINFYKPIVSLIDKKKIFNDHELFILPSYDEGDSIALKEAICSGTKCVITKHCNCYYEDEFKEMIITIKNNDPMLMAVEIENFYFNVNRFQYDYSLLKNKIQNYFSRENYIKDLKYLYKSCIQKIQ